MGLAHSPRIVTNGLVLCLDAGNTKSYPGSGTTWKDLSGNGCDATLTNGPTFNSDNRGSIVFDKVDDFANVTSNLPLYNTTGNFSCQTWIYPIDLGEGNFARIFENMNQTAYSAGSPNNGWNLTTNGTSVSNGIAVSMNGASATPPFTLLFADFFTTYSTWYNVTATVSGVVCRVYRNGVFFGTQNFGAAMTTMVGQSSVLSCVGNRGALDRTFNGRISNVLVYPNKTLSDAEVAQNFNATRGRFGI